MPIRTNWGLLAPALLLFLIANPVSAGDDLAEELPRLPPTAPDLAVETIRVQHGLRLDPVAVEPLVTDPVDACYDADGRLFVAEMRGYPYPEDVATGRVRLLEDVDNDGRFESATTFLDGLSWPTSVVLFDGGIFIAAAPEILYAKDNDGDGVADVRRVAFSGFGNENVQALLNGLLWGPDGWIYGAGSSNGGSIRNLARPDDPPVELGQRDFRFRPDGSAFEAISGGGQFGHSFDDWGHRFTCSNSKHILQIVLPAESLARNPDFAAPSPTAMIAAEGAAAEVYRISPPEPWRIVRTRQRAADPAFRARAAATELVATGFFTSATGVTIYRGTAYPPEFRGNAFIGDVGGNLIHRKTVEPDGSIFRATRAEEGVEFAASTDNWFRPVNYVNTPDGTLLVLDMYRETIEHPWSIPEEIKRHLDLTSGHDRGRIYELLPPGDSPRTERPRLSNASDGELVATLDAPDAWWRETAQRLLMEREASDAIPALRALSAARPSPLGRMHALWTLAILGALTPEDLLPALTDPDHRVREASARLAEPLVEGSNEVKAALLALADDDDPMVRFQAALSIGAVEGPGAVEALAAIVARDPADPWTRSAVMSALSGRSDDLLALLIADPDFTDRRNAKDWVGDLGLLVGASDNSEAIESALAMVGNPELKADLVRSALIGLAEGLRRAGRAPASVIADVAGASLGPLLDEAKATATGDGDLGPRIEATRLLGLATADRAFEVLGNLLNGREPSEIQIAALRTLGDRPEAEVGTLIAGAWRGLGPAARREAIEALFARPDRVEALIDAIESDLIRAGQLDPARRTQLLESSDPSIRERARTLLGESAASNRSAVIDAYQDAIDGDPDRGRLVFRRVCSTCHKAEGDGAEVGPDLATVTNRTREDLLIHILDPNREVLPQYLNYNVATIDGRVLSGQVASESPNSITLRRAEGITDVIPRDQIDEIASTGLSLMPEGIEADVTQEEMADLISYLKGLQGG